jgi:hypothetical protein
MFRFGLQDGVVSLLVFLHPHAEILFFLDRCRRVGLSGSFPPPF